jgi:NNP family nitrate/nitrite transporter-like MFS transporter
MQVAGKATRINLFSLSTPQMRAFHMTWLAFFLCFFAWFGIAPLMVVVRGELGLSREQIKWCIIGSVAITIFARLLVGWFCDRIGPRLTYTWLLIVCALPVMGISLAHNFETFLLFRVLIGAIGASFVITQYHTIQMFAPNCVGTAAATTGGWGNMGGGMTQFAMPLLFSFLVVILGLSEYAGWRVCMVLAGIVCLLAGVAYYFVTQDTPEGNFHELRAAGKLPPVSRGEGSLLQSFLQSSFLAACRDPRVWVLALLYGACFGIELTMDNIIVQYFVDKPEFHLDLFYAGLVAGSLSLLHLFARTLGGLFSDRAGSAFGLRGRVRWLFVAILCEGLLLMLFSQMTVLALAIPALVVFACFMKMSEGATYAVVPFVNKKALGSVAGIVGAGGNAGAVAAGFLFGWDWTLALLILGAVVTAVSFLAFTIRFAPETAPTAMEMMPAPAARPELAVEAT